MQKVHVPAPILINNVSKNVNKMQLEEFRDIPEYEGLYQVSNLGRVKSLKFGKEKILKQRYSKKRYFDVVLYLNKKSNAFLVHRLIAMSFMDYKNNKLIVDHINNNPLDNRLENLQIISQRENLSKDKKGVSKYTGVSFHRKNKKWISTIYLNGKLKYLGSFICELSAHLAYQEELNKINNN